MGNPLGRMPNHGPLLDLPGGRSTRTEDPLLGSYQGPWWTPQHMETKHEARASLIPATEVSTTITTGSETRAMIGNTYSDARGMGRHDKRSSELSRRARGA